MMMVHKRAFLVLAVICSLMLSGCAAGNSGTRAAPPPFSGGGSDGGGGMGR
jgi:hypothetical protein